MDSVATWSRDIMRAALPLKRKKAISKRPLKTSKKIFHTGKSILKFLEKKLKRNRKKAITTER